LLVFVSQVTSDDVFIQTRKITFLFSFQLYFSDLKDTGALEASKKVTQKIWKTRFRHSIDYSV